MTLCYIELGSNEPTPVFLEYAREELRTLFPDIVFGTVMQTEPFCLPSSRPFFNQSAKIRTLWSVEEIKSNFKRIENRIGRKAEDKLKGIVKIDLDLLSYDGTVLKPEDWERPYVQAGIKELTGD